MEKKATGEGEPGVRGRWVEGLGQWRKGLSSETSIQNQRVVGG